MKAIIFYGLILFVFFSCRAFQQKDSVRSFMPGMYVRPFEHEFAKGSDTLIVSLLEGNTYQLIKRSRFTRIRNGITLPAERHTETWTGIYDPTNEVIHEQRKGKLIAFVPKENTLLVGSSAYQKVNP